MEFCNGSNRFLHANGVKVYNFKAKESEIKPFPMCLGNISNICTVNSMKKTGLNGCVYYFPADYNTIDVSDTVAIHKYLIAYKNSI